MPIPGNYFRNSWSRAPRLLSVLRIIVGFTFMAHGMQKLFSFPAPLQAPTPPPPAFLMFTGTLEFAGGLLILFGLFTRPVAFLISGLLAVAYFMVHAPSAFLPLVNKGELAVIYSFLFLYLAFAGGALRVGDDAVGGHRQHERRELRMADQIDVVFLGAARPFHGEVDRDHRRVLADHPHDAGGAVLAKGADDRAAVRKLERARQAGHEADDLGLRHREADLANVEERMSERVDAIAVDVRHGPGRSDGPEFSPDGQWIYFNSTRAGGPMQLWRTGRCD